MFESILRNKPYLVSAIGTDIGKTFFVEKVCCKFVAKKIPIAAIKPIASGFAENDLQSDSAKILTALGFKVSKKNIESITPWRFTESSSPHFAAKNSGQEIDFLAVKNFCSEKIASTKKNNQTLLIEAAGGLMTPINNQKTFLDLAAALQIPVLLVSANYLGSISHTLCAIEAARNRDVEIAKIIINEHSSSAVINGFKTSLASFLEFKETIQNLAGIQTVFIGK